MRTVAVVGAGFIGQGWVALMARAGLEVRVFDSDRAQSARCIEAVRATLIDMQEWNLIVSADEAGKRIHAAADLADAVQDAQYIQECVVENSEVKSRLFAELDAVASAQAVLASSCSAIPPDSFLSQPQHRQRCLVAHPFNPPHLIPLVELVPSSWTDEATLDSTKRFLQTLGLHPIVVRKPVKGYVVNRLQAAVIAEAMSLVEDGVVSPEDLDACMKHGLGRRWAFIGPFETMDLNSAGGFREYVSKFYVDGYQEICADLNVDRPWGDAALASIEHWRRTEIKGERELAQRRRWRDQTLAALSRLLGGVGDGR